MRRVQVDVRQSDSKAAVDLGRALGVSATFGQLLLHRGIQDPIAAKDYLEPRLSELSSPDSMADRDVAAERLPYAIKHCECLAVFGA